MLEAAKEGGFRALWQAAAVSVLGALHAPLSHALSSKTGWIRSAWSVPAPLALT